MNNVAGEGNLIEEQSEIVNKSDDNDEQGDSGNVQVMIIGNNNVFEVMISYMTILIYYSLSGWKCLSQSQDRRQ